MKHDHDKDAIERMEKMEKQRDSMKTWFQSQVVAPTQHAPLVNSQPSQQWRTRQRKLEGVLGKKKRQRTQKLVKQCYHEIMNTPGV